MRLVSRWVGRYVGAGEGGSLGMWVGRLIGRCKRCLIAFGLFLSCALQSINKK